MPPGARVATNSAAVAFFTARLAFQTDVADVADVADVGAALDHAGPGFPVETDMRTSTAAPDPLTTPCGC
jgi:hypothetical protein